MSNYVNARELAVDALNIGEPSWQVLPDGHEEHRTSEVAIMDGEGQAIIRVESVVGEKWNDTRLRAARLCRLLNWTAGGLL